MRLRDELHHDRGPLAVEPHVFEILHPGIFFEKSHDDTFAVDRGHRPDANIHAMRSVLNLNVPVLREESFRDVHVRHDLDSGDQGGL
jgi:hypothetical protein